MHTTATDGRADAETMALAARDAGLSLHRDHRSQPGPGDGERPRRTARARARPPGPRAERAAGRHHRPRRHRVRHPRRTARWISPTTASPSSTSSIASVHSAFNQDEAQMTERLLRAIACPWVDVIGAPDGTHDPQARGLSLRLRAGRRRRRDGRCRAGDQQPVDRLDLDDQHARLARDRGVEARRSIRTRIPRPRSPSRAGDRDGAARLDCARRRPQYASRRTIPEGPAPPEDESGR